MYYVVSKLEPAAMILIRLLLGLALSVAFILSTVFGGDGQGHATTSMVDKVASPAAGPAIGTHTLKYAVETKRRAATRVGNSVDTSIDGGQARNDIFNVGVGDFFGRFVALSANGYTLAVAAPDEASSAVGINDDHENNDAVGSGAVYVFARKDGSWHQQAYIKASNSDVFDRFGISVALSADSHTLAVGAFGESSAATGIDGDQTNNDARNSGAVYVFTRVDNVWHQQAYIKASNTGAGDSFGGSVALSADGHTLVIGAFGEASATTEIDGDQVNNDSVGSGAVYMFARADGVWHQQAYIKTSNTEIGDSFGGSIALSADGHILVAGAPNEDSSAVGIIGVQANDSVEDSGVVYLY
ncbi:FG-GAP repeat protein [Microbulbifer sp. ZKSA004]|uniref:FG-GAP repeat protein n=1 Tax=unclassified Microbulbifer TaxID=2619833 RepID=UPI004039AB03